MLASWVLISNIWWYTYKFSLVFRSIYLQFALAAHLEDFLVTLLQSLLDLKDFPLPSDSYKWVFISFIWEQDCSTDAVITGMVIRYLQHITCCKFFQLLDKVIFRLLCQVAMKCFHSIERSEEMVAGIVTCSLAIVLAGNSLP